MALSKQAQKRLNNIQEPGNTSSSWYLLGLNYCLMLGAAVRDQLLKIPGYIFPTNPALDGYFPFLGITSWSFLGFLSPALLLLSWAGTYKAWRELYYAQNRNIVRYSHALVSFLSSAGWTALFIVGLAASTVVALKVIPYLAAAIFGMHAVYGLFHFAKDLYQAFKAKDTAERHAHLWNAVKQLLNIVTHSLAFTINLLLGIRVTQALSRMTNAVPSMLRTMHIVGDNFARSLPLIYALSITSLTALAAETFKFNRMTFKMLLSPASTIRKTWDNLKKHPLQIIPTLIRIPLRIAALVFAPIHFILYGMYLLYMKPSHLAPKNQAPSSISRKTKPSKQSCVHVANSLSIHPSQSLTIVRFLESKQADFGETQQNKEYKILVKRIVDKIQEIDQKQLLKSETRQRRGQAALLQCILKEALGVEYLAINYKVKQNANVPIYENIFDINKIHCQHMNIPADARPINEIIASVRKDPNYHRQIFNDFWSVTGDIEGLVNDVEAYLEKYIAKPEPVLDRLVSPRVGSPLSQR